LNKTGLEQEIEQLKSQIVELTNRPTQKQLDQAVQQAKAKHQHLVDPATYRAD
jgi:uncharacterized protein YydD (DUF2326 family)